MNTKILFAFCCCLAVVQFTDAHVVRRDTAASGKPSAGTNFLTEGPFADFLKLAQDQVANLQTKILEVAGVKNQQELIDSVAEKTKTLATRVDGLLATVKEDLDKHAGTLGEAANAITTRLQASIKDLQDQNPELVKASEEYKQKVTKQLEGIIGETQKLAGTLQEQSGGISEVASKALKDIVQETAGTTTQIIERVDVALRQKHDFPDTPQKP